MDFFFTFIRSQLFTRLPYPNWNFDGQTVVVTGSNTGLGLEAARHVVRLGAGKVILAVRNIAKGQAAAEDILHTTGSKKNVIDVWQLDLSDYESIKKFGARIQTLDRLDAFIQNAGILTQTFTLSEQSGLESHIDVNCVSSVLVGLFALKKLKETSLKYSTRTRLSFVGSELHYLAKCKEADAAGSLLEALSDKELSDMSDRYRVSKLLLFFAVQELAARSSTGSDTEVIINDITPGACKSDIFRDDIGWIRKTIQSIMVMLIARSTEGGSRTLVHAVHPEIGLEVHGRFLMNCKVAPNGVTVDSIEAQRLRKRWINELFPYLEGVSPGVTDILNERT